jgi:hypothetical protein
MIVEATDTLEETVADIWDVYTRVGVYLIVNYRLLQRQFGASERVGGESSRASTKFRAPLEQHDPLEGLPTSKGPTTKYNSARRGCFLDPPNARARPRD